MYHVLHLHRRRFFSFCLSSCLVLAAVLGSAASAQNPATVLAGGGTAPSKKQQEKIVYLTFDDGPSKNTSHLLDVLEKHQVKASFFLIGPVEEIALEYVPLVSRISAEGHSLAPHSYSHQYSEIYASSQSFFADYQKIADTLYRITGTSSRLYRFPGGSVNRNAPAAVLDEIVCEFAKRSIIFYDWNVVSGDDTAVVYSPETLYNTVMEQVPKFSRALVLFHDASLCSTTADAVDLLIPVLQKQGYRFAALTAQTPPIQFRSHTA